MNDQERNEEMKLSEKDRLTGAILSRLLEPRFHEAGYTLTRLNFKYRGNDWLAIIYRANRLGENQVAFTQGSTLDVTVRTVYSLVVQDKLKWREPKKWD